MDHDFHNTRLIRRAHWLIHLRWLAIGATCVMTVLIDRLFPVQLQVGPIFAVAGLLVLENALSLILLRRTLRRSNGQTPPAVRRNIHVQIAVDLFLLTVLLHYTGGVENPFIAYFVFHMAIAGSLLSVRDSYFQAVWAVVLLSLLALLEYTSLVPHYCLAGFLGRGFHADGLYVLGTVMVLASMLLLVVYMTSDIARQLRSHEQALCHANTVLEQQDRIKDEYVARVTHDIKGHLAAIESCHDVVMGELGDPLTPRQSDFIGRAHRRTQTLAQFVRQLLELTRMRLSNHFEMQVFSLKEVIHRVAEEVDNRVQAKGLTLTCTVVPGAETVHGHAFSLEETITNLVLNAVKYTPAGGQVEVWAGLWNRGLAIEVRDSGIGIPEEDRDKVFDEFFRARNARDIERDGTGLGLAIAKQIVERHGGQITVEPRPGGGTLFRLSLPEERLRRDTGGRIQDVSAQVTNRRKNEVRL
jgi:signal transduction histidine kinase